MKIIKITESQYNSFVNCCDMKHNINEDVFASNLNDKKNTAEITYSKGGSSRRRNAVNGEFLKTDKMDNNGPDTYIIPLKGGINSYNITSISGTKVMHYFKNYFDRKKEYVEVNDKEYEISMKENEFKQFLKQFINKVSNVITYYSTQVLRSNGNETFNTLSIYPVKSSSMFNVVMVDKIIENGLTINGMNIRKVDENILKKDVSKLEKDEDFISKNQDYYNK